MSEQNTQQGQLSPIPPVAFGVLGALLAVLIPTGLVASLPIWMVIGFVATVWYYAASKKRDPDSTRPGLIVAIVALAVLNLFYVNVHITALANSGPTKGTIVDAQTGNPIQGAKVVVVWESVGAPPVPGPWYIYLLPSVRCSVATGWMSTDPQGRYATGWHGLKTWRGCMTARVTVEADGYQPRSFPDYSERQRGARAAGAFSEHVLQLTRKAEANSLQ